ncbi:hypothetical protein ACJIZ3_016527 [Penstemon smallii]|uniref:DNA polymerase eta n=1 Tax=Penstemon smallii TaxID=265156 RepID=A0ABD3STP3_9LAMI
MPRVARAESSSGSRVIAHIDMDCFYVQVEQRKQPTLRGHPTAVVQYNSWKGGGLIAVGYEARKYGVKRSMRGDEAKKVCPDIQLVQVPVARGKADLSVYRNAGSEVVSILARRGRCERASIDEVYLDLSEAAETMLAESPPERLESISEEALKSHVLGLHMDGVSTKDCVKEWFLMSNVHRRDKLLACGALIVAEIRLEVLNETEFTCSAGIAHNKMLAKLASGMNKPAQQTIVPFSSVEKLLEPLPIKKMKQLGGKLGTSLLADLGVDTVGGLLQFSEEKLQECYGINTGTWLWNIARGICGEEVESRLLPKSHGSGKTFPGRQALKTVYSVQKWLNELCEELYERLLCDLEQNKRIAHTLTLHASAYKLNDMESLKKFPSKSCPLRYGIAKIQEDSLNLFNAGLREFTSICSAKIKGSKQHEWAITGLSVSASKIVVIPSGTHSIMKYFHNQGQTCIPIKEPDGISTQNAASLSSSGNGCCVSLHLPGPEINTCENEAKTNLDMPCLNPYEDEIEVCKARFDFMFVNVLIYKDAFHMEKFTDNQDPFLSRMIQEEDRLTEKLLLSSSSGAENGLGSKLTQSHMDSHGPVLKSENQKRKFDKQKGTPSILRFFQSHNSSSFPEQDHVSTFQENEASSSGLQAINGSPGRKSTCSLVEDEFRSNAWNYKSDEIDPVVLNELPPEIQAEVRAWLQPQKRANTVKKGSSIIHYFSPTANS